MTDTTDLTTQDEQGIQIGSEALDQIRASLGALWSSIQESTLNEEYKVWHSQQLADIHTNMQQLVGANAALEEAVRQLANGINELQWQRNITLADLEHERNRNLADVREMLVKDIAHRLGVMDVEARLFVDAVTGQGTADITNWTESEIANLVRDVAQEVADS